MTHLGDLEEYLFSVLFKAYVLCMFYSAFNFALGLDSRTFIFVLNYGHFLELRLEVHVRLKLVILLQMILYTTFP